MKNVSFLQQSLPGYTKDISIGPMSNMWPTQNELKGIFRGFLFFLFFFSYLFVLILWFLISCFCGISLFANVWISLSVYMCSHASLPLCFSGSFFRFLLLLLFLVILILVVIVVFLPHLIFNKKQESI